jgi:hypothetical protein
VVVTWHLLMLLSLTTRLAQTATATEMLVGANKHFYRRRHLCQPSGEAKECQQAFRVPLSGRQ